MSLDPFPPSVPPCGPLLEGNLQRERGPVVNDGWYRDDLRLRACLIQRLPLATLTSTRVSSGCSMTRLVLYNTVQEEILRELLVDSGHEQTPSLPPS